MDIEKKNSKLNFEELDSGDVFELSSAVCMKVTSDTENNAVDLRTGVCRTVSDNTPVTVLKANLIVR